MTKGQHIHSQDPLKPAIVAAIIAKTGGEANKVTLVRKLKTGNYCGEAMRWNPAERFYDRLGWIMVTPEEVSRHGPVW